MFKDFKETVKVYQEFVEEIGKVRTHTYCDLLGEFAAAKGYYVRIDPSPTTENTFVWHAMKIGQIGQHVVVDYYTATGESAADVYAKAHKQAHYAVWKHIEESGE